MISYSSLSRSFDDQNYYMQVQINFILLYLFKYENVMLNWFRIYLCTLCMFVLLNTLKFDAYTCIIALLLYKQNSFIFMYFFTTHEFILLKHSTFMCGLVGFLYSNLIFYMFMPKEFMSHFLALAFSCIIDMYPSKQLNMDLRNASFSSIYSTNSSHNLSISGSSILSN